MRRLLGGALDVLFAILVSVVFLVAGLFVLMDVMIDQVLIKLHLRKKPVRYWSSADEGWKKIPWG